MIPSSSATQYFRIDGDKPYLEAGLQRDSSQKEDAAKTRGELEEEYNKRLLLVAAEKDQEIAILRLTVETQNSICSDMAAESDAYQRSL